tara:strand:+ start:1308 stop:1661 length:354 start_codon:yes stop_codon:yes gene_type:complete
MKEVLTGRVICKGKVKGIARVINSYDDLDKVEKDEIIIASQTDMNYTPYLQRCSGLITETGSRYCHAAIYSRENNIPCITGVKNARLLIDGGIELVLDANKNEVYTKQQNETDKLTE